MSLARLLKQLQAGDHSFSIVAEIRDDDTITICTIDPFITTKNRVEISHGVENAISFLVFNLSQRQFGQTDQSIVMQTCNMLAEKLRRYKETGL